MSGQMPWVEQGCEAGYGKPVNHSSVKVAAGNSDVGRVIPSDQRLEITLRPLQEVFIAGIEQASGRERTQ